MGNRRTLQSNAMHIAACVALLAQCSSVASAQELSVKATVDKDQVFVGESLQFYIHVDGSESPEKPDVSSIKDFDVHALGGQITSQSIEMNINGVRKHIDRKGYVFVYRLTPKHAGALDIPSITVRVNGKTLRTGEGQITVNKAIETDALKFKLELSKPRCYVGEPIILKGALYFRKEIRNATFTVPLLDEKRFDFCDTEAVPNPNRKYYRVPLNGDEVIVALERGQLNGEPYAVLRFSKVLTPKQAGVFDPPPASALCDALVGYRQRRRRGFWDDSFFDDFFGGGNGVYKKFAVRANPVPLHVLPVPKAGQPPGYSGLVGAYRIKASAKPTDVSVGDPITLTIKVSGPPYLDHVELPSLQEQSNLAKDFKIPKDMAPGKVENGAKVFTQTIRALRPDVTEIPPIELPYFDVDQGTYAIAKSNPIPLTVKKAKVVTAQDAEGRDLPTAAKTELVAWTKGIAHNYEDLDVLKDQRAGPAMWVRSPVWLTILGLPPIAYFALLAATTVVRRRAADPGAILARRAYGELTRALRQAKQATPDDLHVMVLEAIRAYLGAKLRLPSGALTFADAKASLAEQSVDEEAIESLGNLFKECEAGRYGGMSSDNSSNIIDHAFDLAKELEKQLK